MESQMRGAATAGAAWIAIGPMCVACTIPAVWHLAVAWGLLGAATWAHYSSLVAMPLIAAVLMMNWRRHHDRAVLLFAASGLAVIAVHIGMHVAHWRLHSTLFDVTNWTGFALLSAGVLANTRLLMLHRAAGPPTSRADLS